MSLEQPTGKGEVNVPMSVDKQEKKKDAGDAKQSKMGNEPTKYSGWVDVIHWC